MIAGKFFIEMGVTLWSDDCPEGLLPPLNTIDATFCEILRKETKNG